MKKIISIGITGAIVAAILLCTVAFRFRSTEPLQQRVIQIKAKKFDFTPGEITLKKGETVILELSSTDKGHGFNLLDFKVRSDIKPGVVTRIKFTPDKTGTFTFSCDVFCGDGHEDMSGTLTVTD